MKTNEEIINQENIWGCSIFMDMHTALLKLPDCGTCTVVWSSNENGWEHVSVSPRKRFDRLDRINMPTWNDMSVLKDMFWHDNEEAYQIMPKKSEYVNLKDNCLHLWKPSGHELGETLAIDAFAMEDDLK